MWRHVTGIPEEILVQEVRLQYEDEMKRLREEYQREQNSKHQLQSDLQALRDQYEKQLSNINWQATSNMQTRIIDAKTPSELIVSEALKSENMKVSAAQQEVLLRLKKLQESMVGGERAGDRELKEKRLRKKRASERRLQALAKVLSKVDDEDGVVLQVYDDIQQELRIKTDTLRKCRTKVKALEREILDLQSEFENERTDYLETIRKQEQQLKLYQQICEKIATTLKKECNYSDLEKIRNLAVWSDDAHHWKLPDLVFARTKLPPAGVFTSLAPDTSLPHGQPSNSNSSGSSSGKSSSSSAGRNSCPDSPPGEAFIMQRLQRSEKEDIAGNYFKPKRATELLNRAKEDASRAFGTWREYTNRSKGTSNNGHSFNNLLNASLNQTGFHSSLNGLNLNATYGGSSLPNSLWTNISNTQTNGWIGNGYNISPDESMRRPARLEALPLLNGKQDSRFKNGISQRNTMDII